MLDGTTILQKGTKVRGRVVGVEDSGGVKGLASIYLSLTDIMLSDRMIAINTGVVLASKGKQIQYGPETRLNFTLTDSVRI